MLEAVLEAVADALMVDVDDELPLAAALADKKADMVRLAVPEDDADRLAVVDRDAVEVALPESEAVALALKDALDVALGDALRDDDEDALPD